MTVNFDLISDLYLESLDGFSWENKATSRFCIIAGNISKDHDVLFEFLEELAKYYDAVFFIDGDHEHDDFNGDFFRSYASLKDNLHEINKVLFLHENIVILNGIALLATNGWTTFNFTNKNQVDETIEFLEARNNVPEEVSNNIFKMAVADQHYMFHSIESCQELEDVKKIVVISNSVPLPRLIMHDEKYNGTILGDIAGNNGITDCLAADTDQKVTSWLFGKYYGDLDFTFNNIRYVNNSFHTTDLKLYHPKIIKI